MLVDRPAVQAPIDLRLSTLAALGVDAICLEVHEVVTISGE